MLEEMERKRLEFDLGEGGERRLCKEARISFSNLYVCLV